MKVRLAEAALIVVGMIALVASGSAVGATKPKTQAQAVEMSLKTSMIATFKKEKLALTVGKVTCVLPKNGAVVHCTAAATGPPADHEDVVFKVAATLQDSGKITWTATHTCSDSKTHKPFKC
jgi:hypothetical protein